VDVPFVAGAWEHIALPGEQRSAVKYLLVTVPRHKVPLADGLLVITELSAGGPYSAAAEPWLDGWLELLLAFRKVSLTRAVMGNALWSLAQ
jgi:hypothetical protein